MRMISEKTMRQIRDLADEALKRTAAGEDAVQAAADLYCERLPDKAPALGRMMAGRLNETVERYERACAAARENRPGWLAEETEALLEGRSPEERREVLVRMAQAMARLNGEEPPAVPEGTGPAAEAGLIGLLEELNRRCALDKAALEALTGALDAVETPEDAAESLSLEREQLHAARVLMSMAAYLNAKNGAFEDIPPTMTLDETALAVSAALDARQAAWEVAGGEISAERGARVMRAVGAALGFTLSTAFALLGAGCLMEAIPAGQPVLAALAYSLTFGLLWNVTAERFAAYGGQLFGGAWKLARCGARHLRRGLQRIRGAMAPEVAAQRQEAAAEA